jgi:hypothetical protein
MNDVDRIIHEPARLMIVALLAGAKEADFLFILDDERAPPQAVAVRRPVELPQCANRKPVPLIRRKG